MVDRIFGIFVLIVFGIVVVIFIIWYFVIGMVDGLFEVVIVVLVIVCFCVFGFVMLIVIMVGIGKGVESGILFKGGEYLECIFKVDIIVFDKIGILIEGKLEVSDKKVVNDYFFFYLFLME